MRFFVRRSALGTLLVLVVLPLASPGETPTPQTGLYEVEGITTVTSTGHKRLARGQLVLVREPGERCTMTFNMRTQVERSGQEYPVTLTGECACEMVGAYLSATCEAQWLTSAIPEIDPDFEFIPGKLGPRVISSIEFKPEAHADAWRMEVSSQSEQHADYPPTVSLMRATRKGDIPVP